MKKFISLAMCLITALGILSGCATTTPPAEPQGMTEGTYTSEVTAMHGPLKVEVTVTATEITDVKVTSHVETPGVGDAAVINIPVAIVANQSTGVDAVSGATITTTAIKRAVEDCLTQAGADVAAFRAFSRDLEVDIDATADVIIVGGGGAGLTAAITALEAGAEVILIEKMGFVGGNSIVAGGIYNAPDPSKQDYAEFSGDLDSYVNDIVAETPVSDLHASMIETLKEEFAAYKASDKLLFDSPTFFALQTWNGGDKVGYLDMLKIMCDNALDGLKWLEGMGMEFKPAIELRSGSLYPRTHAAVMPNGMGYFAAFEQGLMGQEKYTEMLDTKAVGLIMDGDKVVGVNAVGKDGNIVTLHATKGVILATGGFGGNVELRQEYCEGEKWPDLSASVPTSNMAGVTGDGIFFARDAGAILVNMEQIQLLHSCNPITGATYDITVNDLFINKEGLRFVREDGRRDEMSKAIIAQTDSVMYSVYGSDHVPDPVARLALGGMSLQYMLDNNVSGYVTAPTIEELAAKINVPADALVQSVADFNTYVDGSETDPLGRIVFGGNKVETGPFYAYPRSPAVHHTMGGVLIDSECRALKEGGTPVPGLYCAGEIAGVLHGGNRIGGNALVDFIVFGRIAGESAAAGK